MEIIPPLAIELAYTGTPTYIYNAWVVGTFYAAGVVVRHQVNGAWRDFRANYYHEATTANAPAQGVPAGGGMRYYWSDLGSSAASGGYTYATPVALSRYPAWEKDAAVALSEAVFDPADRKDYVSLTAISDVDNLYRPSDAVLSADSTIAARWQLLGSANAWAAIDYELATKTLYTDGAGAILTGKNWATYRFLNPSINLIASPDDFTTGWSTGQCTVAANNQADPTNRSSPSNLTADTVTASSGTTVGNNANIWRDFGAVKQGAQLIFAIYARSDTVTSLRIQLIENWGQGSQELTTHTFTVSSSWRYLQVYHEATQDAVTMHAMVGNLTAPGQSIILWHGHFGQAKDAFDRFVVMGVENVSQLSINFHPWFDIVNRYHALGIGLMTNLDNAPRHDLTAKSSVMASVFRDDLNTVQSNTGLVYATSTFYLGLAVTPRDPSAPAAIGSFALGQATALGGTEWSVESSILSFSRKERDPTFGITKFVRRGNAKQLRATAYIDTAVISGDTVQAVLTAFDGQPVFFDFNNADSAYDRLRVFGFYTSAKTILQASSWESLVIDVESLVE